MKSMVDYTQVTKMDQEEATEKTNGHRIVTGVKVKIITVTGTTESEPEIMVINTNQIIFTEITIITITSVTAILIITITEMTAIITTALATVTLVIIITITIIRGISIEISTKITDSKVGEIFHRMGTVALISAIIEICRIITIKDLAEPITRETVTVNIIANINITLT